MAAPLTPACRTSAFAAILRGRRERAFETKVDSVHTWNVPQHQVVGLSGERLQGVGTDFTSLTICSSHDGGHMFKNTRLLACLFLAAGALLGWAAASADFGFLEKAKAAPITEAAAKTMLTSQTVETPACCSEGSIKGELISPGRAERCRQLAGAASEPGGRGSPPPRRTRWRRSSSRCSFRLTRNSRLTRTRLTHGETHEVGHHRSRSEAAISYTLKATAQGKTVTRTVNLRHGSKQSRSAGQFSRPIRAWSH